MLIPMNSAFFTFLVLAASAALAGDPRIRYTINEQWRYAAGPVENAATRDFDDHAWSRINLPHTWNAQDAFDEAPGYRRGSGWYRKRLALDPALRGKRLFLYFEGANQVADVFVNGRHAGQHVGGYTAFSLDVTDLVSWDKSNLVAVRVDNSHSPDIPPLNADFTFYGGIYRDVSLIATDPVHITVTDHASPGVFISTPRVSAESATVRFRGTLENRSGRAARVRVWNRVLDSQGAEVASASSLMRLLPGDSGPFDQQAVVRRPSLWSPAAPHLYRVRTEVHEGDRVLDVVENPLGFRWFSVDPDRGFFLNGEPLRLSGTNRHQDFAGLGNALPDEFHRRDVERIRENGFRFLRLAHYPQDPAVLDAADRLGVVIWEEIPVVNLISMSPAFAENSERMLREMIRQHYNHPSILFWGYMNEVLLIKPDPVPEGYYPAVVELTRRLEAAVDSEDPSRITVMALSRDEVKNDYGIGDIPDLLGLNLYFGWYYETLETLTPFLEALHRSRPGRPLLVSEYGADSDERVHSRTPVAFDFSSEYAQRFHTSSFAQLEALPYLAGTAVWNQFDFGSEFRSYTKHALNQKGLFFHDRTPKDTAFYYKAALADQPLLYIAREWNERAGSRPEDASQPVWVYTNAAEVELFVNGRSAGRRTVRNRTAEWTVELADGVNHLHARAAHGERWLKDTVSIRYAARAAHSPVQAVNAGALYSYVDAAGMVWLEDYGFAGGRPARTHHRIFGTPEDALFQSAREGAEGYRFAGPDGPYEVSLLFAEIAPDVRPGQRVFSVSVNGTVFFSDMDLARDYGAFTAGTKRIQVTAKGGEGIRIGFSAQSGKPLISGILIRRIH